MAEARESGWARRSSWDNSWLFAGPGAGPVRLSFPVPDGLYFLSVDINGCCEMEVNGLKKVLRSPEFVQNLRWKVNKVDFGDEHVAGLHREWIAIRLLGFEPIIDGRVRSLKDRERDRKRVERLRALGYIK